VGNAAELMKDGDRLIDPDMTPVAVDNGYANQKICFWVADGEGGKRIEEILLPSRARMGITQVSAAGPGSDSGIYTLNGDPWTVGVDISAPETMTGKQYAYSDVNAILVNHSLISAGFGGKDVRLSTGVPISHFYSGSEHDAGFLSRIRESISVPVVPRSTQRAANIRKHDIFPESVGAAIDWLIGVDGSMRDDVELGVAICDIGGNTTDISVIHSGLTLDPTRSESVEQMGVMNIRSDLKRLIQKEHDVERVRDAQLDAALRTGYCSLFGRKVDVMALISEARRITGRRISSFVAEHIGDGSDLDCVIFVGGGAAVLPNLVDEYKNALVPHNPEFANARGFLKQMTYLG